MPAFKYNPGDVSAGFPTYPKGSYALETGEAKTFYRQGKNGKADNYGVRFIGKIVEADDQKWVGKKYALNCFMHTDDSQSMTKQAQMAVLGFDKKQEDDFDLEFGGKDWDFNTDTGALGDAWKEMQKKIVIVDLDTRPNPEKQDELQQQQTGIRPYRGSLHEI